MVLLFGATCFACQGHHFKDKPNRAKNKEKRRFFVMGVLRYFFTGMGAWNDRDSRIVSGIYFSRRKIARLSVIFFIFAYKTKTKSSERHTLFTLIKALEKC